MNWKKAKKMKYTKIYKTYSWHISRDPFDKNRFQAVKGKERITGNAEQIIQAIDRRAMEEMK